MIRLFILLLVSVVFSATYYVDKDGSDAGTGAIGDPFQTWQHTVDQMSAGDTALFRNESGTDTFPEEGGVTGIQVDYSGTAANKKVFKSYPGERAVIRADSVKHILALNSSYHVIDSIDFVVSRPIHEGYGIINMGYDGVSNDIEIRYCKFEFLGPGLAGFANISCIALQIGFENGMDSTWIHHCNFYSWDDDTGHGIETYQCRYARIENNSFFGMNAGIHFKHRNRDTDFADSSIIRNNFVYNCQSPIYGNLAYTIIENNIFITSTTYSIDLGVNGGFDQGTVSIVRHNTTNGITRLLNPAEGPVTYYRIIDNIFSGGQQQYAPNAAPPDAHYTSSDWNMIPEAGNQFRSYGTEYALAGWRTLHSDSMDQNTFTGTPTYTNGSGSMNIPSDYALDAGSDGENGASDGEDVGADVTTVGSGVTEEPPAETPTIDTITKKHGFYVEPITIYTSNSGAVAGLVNLNAIELDSVNFWTDDSVSVYLTQAQQAWVPKGWYNTIRVITSGGDTASSVYPTRGNRYYILRPSTVSP